MCRISLCLGRLYKVDPMTAARHDEVGSREAKGNAGRGEL
jgi:hypothetical protein